RHQRGRGNSRAEKVSSSHGSDSSAKYSKMPQFQAEVHEKNVREKTSGSLQRHQRSSRTLAGGVSSGMRRAAKPYPLFFDRGAGSRVIDVDGNSYLDYGLAWGPLILGHSHPAV